ncbi:WecB/TagA/CpsF family glycosyltransferase [Muricauda sp. ANG21]|uniref:WecB/TagA/CpsF family glycosyltransferase n=1 Tax=Allomuricauda sp. ANG21 TaxID=3042468 RepID=UPI0034555F62
MRLLGITKTEKKKLYFWLCAFVAMTLPFPKLSFNSFAIILLGIFSVFLQQPFLAKTKLIKKNLHWIVIASIPTLLALFGLLWTEDYPSATTNLKPTFLIFSIVFFSSSEKLSLSDLSKLLDLFTISVITASILAVGKAVWLDVQGLGKYYFYLDFGKVLGHHPTYFALFICICSIHLAVKANRENKLLWLYFVAMAFLGLVLYLLSSKMSIIALIVVLASSFLLEIYLYKNVKTNLWSRTKLAGILLLCLIFLTPNFQKRLTSEKASNFEERLELWEAVFNKYQQGSIIFGAGTGDGRKGLVKEYQEVGYEIAAKEHYNAHNQYLEELLFYGFFGLIIFLLQLIIFFILPIQKKYSLGYYLLICFMLFMMSESILERHSGEILYSYFMIILFSILVDNNNFIEKNDRIKVLNTYVDNLSNSETLELIDEAIKERKHIHHVVVNASKIVSMQTDLRLRQSVNSSDLINADGQAVVWASKILGKPLKERVAGIDLMQNLVEMAFQNDYKIYFFGAKEEIVEAVVKKYSKKYSEDIIAGYRNGYFKKEEEKSIASQIRESGAHMLFVAISSPTKENFLFENKHVLSNVNFIMGVGGSFDVIAGKVRRAPKWMQKAGLEWCYRLMQEPKRMWKRYVIGNSKFILLVLKERFKF